MILKEKSYKILEVLSIFKFLSSSQFILLKVANHRSNLVKPINDLIFYNLIGKLTFGVDPKKWKLENIYYLKEKWVNLLKEQKNYNDDFIIKYPIWTSNMFFRDYLHRIMTIQFHIKLFIYLVQNNWTIKTFDTYFDKIGSNRVDANLRAKTKLIFSDGRYFIPDAICLYYNHLKAHIFTFEYYRGKDTKRVLSQFNKHLKSLNEWLPSKTFNKKIGSKVICLFETKESMQSVIKRFQDDAKFQNFRYLFIFGCLVSNDVDITSFIDCDGNRVIL